MEIKTGAQVVTADGERVGDVDSVVLNPETKEVTHLVVEKGFLFTEDKVVPADLVNVAKEDKVTLKPSAGDLEEFPEYEESHYVPVGQVRDPAETTTTLPRYAARSLYWYPPLGYTHTYTGAFASYPMAEYVQAVERNIPEGTIALDEGANIIGSDGEHIGDLERVMLDEKTNRATHILISEGFILKEKKLVPTTWITNVLEDEVHLSVDSEFVDDLPEYEPEA